MTMVPAIVGQMNIWLKNLVEIVWYGSSSGDTDRIDVRRQVTLVVKGAGAYSVVMHWLQYTRAYAAAVDPVLGEDRNRRQWLMMV